MERKSREIKELAATDVKGTKARMEEVGGSSSEIEEERQQLEGPITCIQCLITMCAEL